MTVSIMENKISLIISLFCLSAVSNEVVKNLNISKKTETLTVNTMTSILNWRQQRKSNVTVRWIEQRKMSFLKLGLKNIKKSMHQKRNNFLKIIENSINRWTFHKKNKTKQ